MSLKYEDILGTRSSAESLPPHVAVNFRRALQMHQEGHLAQAEAVYREIIKAHPKHFDSVHLIGVIALQGNDHERAVALIGNAIAINPNSAAAHQNLGSALLALHRLGAAVASYDRAIVIKPDLADAHYNRGNALRELTHHAAAVVSYDRAIVLKPDFAEAYSNRAISLRELGKLEIAIASYDSAIALKADFAIAYYNRGIALRQLDRIDDAIASYKRAIELRPEYVDAYANLGATQQDLGQYEVAIESYRQAIRLRPDVAEAHYGLANVLRDCDCFDAAIVSYERAISLKPDYAEAYLNRGVAMHHCGQIKGALLSYGRAIAIKPDYVEAHSNKSISLLKLKLPDEALVCCETALSLKPNYADAHLNRGIVLQELGRFNEAVLSYDSALALEPHKAQAYSNRGNALRELSHFKRALEDYDEAISIDSEFAEAYWNKALTLLLLGEFELGWPLYEWRWKRKAIAGQEREFGKPLWLGADTLGGKCILLHSEQGLGDTIQFCRFAKAVARRSARVVMEVPRHLATALRGLEGVDEWVERGQTLPEFDYHCPLMSLPLALGTDDRTGPSGFPYLSCDSIKARHWADRLGPKTRRRVGLVWSGNAEHKNDFWRSIDLGKLIEKLPDDREYISLQKEVRDADRPILAASAVRHFGDELVDFSDTAALCSLLDVVVSVDTSVAHLSAALGQETLILLPHLPDWRWLLERTDSPWYPTARLYRQDSSRDWESVLSRVAVDL